MGEIKDEIIPQIKSTAINVCIILVIGPMAGIALTYANGELHTWKDLPKAIDHALFASVMLAFGWMAMASPLSKRFRMLASAVRTMPSGDVQEMRVSLDQPSGGAQTTTATVDPDTQKITIEQAPKGETGSPVK